MIAGALLALGFRLGRVGVRFHAHGLYRGLAGVIALGACVGGFGAAVAPVIGVVVALAVAVAAAALVAAVVALVAARLVRGGVARGVGRLGEHGVVYHERGDSPFVLFGKGRLVLVLFRDVMEHRGGSFAVLGSAARHGAQLVGFKRAQGVIPVLVKLHLDRLAQEIDLHGGAVPVLGFYECALLGHVLYKILIRFLLVSQAAHQPPAAAGNLRGVEGEGLHLCHLRGDGLKIVKKLVAAVRPPAYADAAYHLRLIAHADLAQLYAVAEDACKILYQLAKVHSAVGSEEKERF